MRRRTWCLATALAACGQRAQAAPRWLEQPLPTALKQVAAGATGAWAVDADAVLWRLASRGATWQRVAEGLDPQAPLALGHGRLAARAAGGGLQVWEAQGNGTNQPRITASPGLDLAPHAGLLVLPLAVVAVALREGQAHVVRLEPETTGRWREVARSAAAVLPDARPVQADLDGSGDGGHVVVFAGPDSTRYGHAVLGDGIEPTQLLWLERHTLTPLRSLVLPAPHVFEDIAPRPVLHPQLGRAQGLLTVRAGPEGGQLALVTASTSGADALALRALGEGVGGRHRWLAPTTDGRRWLAVHTPHLGGVLHGYAWRDALLPRERLLAGISTHRIGSRELDLAVWLGDRLLAPSQDQRRLQLLDIGRGAATLATLPLAAPVAQTRAWPEAGAALVLLDDGRLWMADQLAPAR
jgi:hypothetical protein